MIKLMFLLIMLLFLLPTPLAAAGVWETCPFGETDCEYPGDCGRYIDTNKDGICDRGQADPSKTVPGTTGKLDAQIGTNGTDGNYAVNHSGPAGLQNRGGTVEGTIIQPPAEESAQFGLQEQGRSRLYSMLPILIALMVLYLISDVLTRMKVIRMVTHRKIWNMALLISFLPSAVLGLLLVLRLDFDIDPEYPFDILYWHVEFSIAMGIVAFFHVFWHWKYFKRMILPSKQGAD